MIDPTKIELFEVQARPKGDPLLEPRSAVHRALKELLPRLALKPWDRVALAVGSRGIASLTEVVRAAVTFFQELGTLPFIVPAMGSHGGGTAVGQEEHLQRLGIDASTIGVPVQSTVETRIIGQADLADGGRLPIHFDRLAAKADHVVVINRVKPHTRFGGAVQSGLSKMCLVGLGNPAGANTIHHACLRRGFTAISRAAHPRLLTDTPLACGLALVENSSKELALVRGGLAEDFIDLDAELLPIASAWMPRLPLAEIDLLVVDVIGKEISGTGMDTNVIGRKEDDTPPRVLRIFVRDLSSSSGGNATGIGFADAITESCAAKVNRTITTLNCFTALRPAGARLPATFASDAAALQALLPTVGRGVEGDVKLVRITDTAHLDRFLVSRALLEELNNAPGFELSGRCDSLRFDGHGQLMDNLKETPST